MEEVEIYPSTWFLIVVMVVILWLSYIVHNIDQTNEKLDVLIKLQQQIMVYQGEVNENI